MMKYTPESEDGEIIPFFREKDLPSEWSDKYFTKDRFGDFIQIYYATSPVQDKVKGRIQAIIPFSMSARQLHNGKPIIFVDQILSKAVWSHVWKDEKEPIRFSKKYDCITAFLLSARMKMNNADYIKYMRDYYYETAILRAIKNIWNGYCILEGTSSITRDAFVLWLSRLHCVMFDLIDDPLISTGRWIGRLYFIKLFVSHQNDTQHLEYFVNDNWARHIKDKSLTNKLAHRLRIDDAKQLLNDFNDQISPVTALEKFMTDCFYWFGVRLLGKKYLLKCGNCGRYCSYKEGKKFCSPTADGRNCGKKARSKRNYRAHLDERRIKSRHDMQEVRKFFKEKGLDKAAILKQNS